jgi:hypothetical protein
MKISQFFGILEQSNKKIVFQLPGGIELTGDLHITEVKNTHIQSTDCGGHSHTFEETVIQLWKNEASSKQAIWSTDKVSKIMKTVYSQQPILEESHVYFEYGDSANLSSKYSIEYSIEGETITFLLLEEAPQCKPQASISELAVCC